MSKDKAPEPTRKLIFLGKEIEAQSRAKAWIENGWAHEEVPMGQKEAEADPKIFKVIKDLKIELSEGYPGDCYMLPPDAFEVGFTISKQGYYRDLSYTVGLAYICNRCKYRSAKPIPDRHFSTKRCMRVGAEADAESRGYQSLNTSHHEQGVSYEYLSASQINALRNEYDSILIGDTLFVRPNLNDSVTKYLVEKAKLKSQGKRSKVPTLLKYLASIGVTPDRSKLLTPSADSCCVSGCTMRVEDSFLLANKMTYRICPEHMGTFLVALDKFLEQTSA